MLYYLFIYGIVRLQMNAFYLFLTMLYCIQPRVVERHFLDLRKKYGAVFAVDLVNKVQNLPHV